jgi:type IV secretory pathway VirB6-like protein
MMRQRPLTYSLLLLLGLVGVFVFISASSAFAQAGGSAGAFSCFGGQASGTLYSVNASCPTTLEFDHLFSFLVCNMEELSSNLMGNMFCGMITTLNPAISAVITLAVLFFSVAFTMGVIPATAREFQVFLLKIACIWAFATHSDLLIGYGYKMLVNGMRDGVDAVLTNFGSNGTTVTVYGKLDEFLGKIINFATSYVGVNTSGNTGADGCKDAVFAAMAVMAIAFPPFAFLGIALLMRVAITFLRAVFGYIYALVGIAFLLTLSPFFLSFYLFRQTRSYFDKWLGYLVSFALQIVILFSFLAFILSVDVSTVSASFADIVMEKEVVKEGGSFRAPWEYCTLCDFEAVDPSNNNKVIPEDQYAQFIGKGKLKCKTPKTAIEIDTTFSPNSGKLNTLIKFTSAGFMALLVLAYILEGLLAYAASLAQNLSGGMGGATYAPQLGGGKAYGGRPVTQMPFDNAYNDFEQGFDTGFASQRNSASGLLSGIRSGISNMSEGKIYERDKLGGTVRDAKGNPVVKAESQDAGFKNRFIDWLTDPNRLNQ